MIYVTIDQFTPCLRDSNTQELIETEAVSVVRKSFLAKFNVDTHWYVDWSRLTDEYEIYALVIKGTAGIQGLVALQKDEEARAAFIAWMVASPESNKELTESPRYLGVGGHLFSIAAKKIDGMGLWRRNARFCCKRKTIASLLLRLWGGAHRRPASLPVFHPRRKSKRIIGGL